MKANTGKRAIHFLLSLSLLLTLTIPSAGAASIEDYTDVPDDYWGREGLAYCVEHGYMQGVGDNRMNPDGQLSLAEFATMLQRVFLTDERRAEMIDVLKESGETLSTEWPVPDMFYAQQSGITKGLDTSKELWSQTVSRANMAVMIDNVLTLQGQPTPDLEWVYQSISDWDSIQGTTQAQSILRVYRDGIIQGTDGYGKFSPDTYVTRATAAVIAYRITHDSARLSYTPSTNTNQPPIQPGDTTSPTTDHSAPITIHEGQGASRVPQPGDTYIKADGTKITLQMHENGVLGWGQGYVDYLSNTPDDTGKAIRIGGMAWVTINGKDMSGVVYKGTQGVFTSDQWKLIQDSTEPTYDGKSDGETTSDGLWVWNSSFGDWAWAGPRVS